MIRQTLAVVALVPLVAIMLVGALFIVLSFLPPFFFVLPITMTFGLGLMAVPALAAIGILEWGFVRA